VAGAGTVFSFTLPLRGERQREPSRSGQEWTPLAP
jgi:hypothetical protein